MLFSIRKPNVEYSTANKVYLFNINILILMCVIELTGKNFNNIFFFVITRCLSFAFGFHSSNFLETA